MEPGGQEIISREQKIASYRRHRRGQKEAEHALNATTLEEAVNVGGPKELIDAKDEHETAAVTIRHDLKPE